MNTPHPIKHVSLDIWKTLFTPRPTYGQMRAIMLSETLGVTEEVAEKLYKQADQMVGIIATPNGDALTHVIRILYQAVHKHCTEDEVAVLRMRMEMLFSQYPPIIHPAVVAEMQRIKKTGITFSVTSNVGLMNGFILRQVLLKQDVPLLFGTFDDEVGASKPDPEIFREVIRMTRNWRHPEAICPSSILHIGDDKECDSGAIRLGMQCEIIEGVHALLPVLRKI